MHKCTERKKKKIHWTGMEQLHNIYNIIRILYNLKKITIITISTRGYPKIEYSAGQDPDP